MPTKLCDFTVSKQNVLTSLKLSSHDLAIEKGRHQKIARQERVCNNCTMSFLRNRIPLFVDMSKIV